jgi:hypothetical protein
MLAISSLALAESDNQLLVGTFSEAQPGKTLPAGWKPLTFEKIPTHTQYDLVKDGDEVVVKAVSEQSSSGITREIRIDPKEFPVVEWRWKVANILKNGNVNEKSGDDYPARLYITFEYDSTKVGFFEKAKYETVKLIYGQYPPIGAINYIWESKSPIGTMVPNPYTDRVNMIVIESGETRLNEWITEERNIFEDYKKAFGEDPRDQTERMDYRRKEYLRGLQKSLWRRSPKNIRSGHHDGYRQHERTCRGIFRGYCL